MSNMSEDKYFCWCLMQWFGLYLRTFVFLNQSLRGAAGASRYQECMQLDCLRTSLSFPEEPWTEMCARSRWGTASRSSKQFCQTPVQWIQRICWGYRSVGERLLSRNGNDSAPPSLKSPPQCGDDSGKLGNGCRKQWRSESLPSPAALPVFISLGRERALCVCFGNLVRLGGSFPSLNEPSSRVGMF